jgi:hypothetical protein
MKSSLLLHCKKATEMVEQNDFVKLSFMQNVQLKFHLAICSACKTYYKQSMVINQFFTSQTVESMKEYESDKTKTLKNHIISNINKL